MSKADLFCCGRNRHTKFCPECGKSITSGPLSGLVTHLLTVVGQKKKFVERAKGWPVSESQARRIAEGEKSAAKYQAWADELQRMIDEKRNS